MSFYLKSDVVYYLEHFKGRQKKASWRKVFVSEHLFLSIIPYWFAGIVWKAPRINGYAQGKTFSGIIACPAFHPNLFTIFSTLFVKMHAMPPDGTSISELADYYIQQEKPKGESERMHRLEEALKSINVSMEEVPSVYSPLIQDCIFSQVIWR